MRRMRPREGAQLDQVSTGNQQVPSWPLSSHYQAGAQRLFFFFSAFSPRHRTDKRLSTRQSGPAQECCARHNMQQELSKRFLSHQRD